MKKICKTKKSDKLIRLSEPLVVKIIFKVKGNRYRQEFNYDTTVFAIPESFIAAFYALLATYDVEEIHCAEIISPTNKIKDYIVGIKSSFSSKTIMNNEWKTKYLTSIVKDYMVMLYADYRKYIIPNSKWTIYAYSLLDSKTKEPLFISNYFDSTILDLNKAIVRRKIAKNTINALYCKNTDLSRAILKELGSDKNLIYFEIKVEEVYPFETIKRTVFCSGKELIDKKFLEKTILKLEKLQNKE